MTSARFDQNIERLISSCINSVEQLEILLLLRSRQELNIEIITFELRTSAISVEKRLSDLLRKNLIAMRELQGEKIFSYAPPPNLAETLDQLSALYISHRVAIINLIFSKQSDTLLGFSDAFRFKE